MYVGIIVALLSCAGSLLLLVMGGYSFRWGRYRAGLPFLFFCIAVSLYSVGYAFEILSTSVESALVWNRIQYLGIPLVPPLWVLLARVYSGDATRLTKYSWVALFGIPVMTQIIRLTPQLSHLHYAAVEFVPYGALQVLKITRGPWYMITTIHATLLVIYGAVIYTGAARAGQIMPLQSLLMVIASLLPLMSLWVNAANVNTWGLDTGPLMVTLASILMFLSLFRYRLLDVVVIAHEEIFERSKDAMLVVNQNAELLDFNAAAAAEFPEISRQKVGQSLKKIMAKHREILDCLASGVDAQITVSHGEHTHVHYQLRQTPVYGHFGGGLGRTISFVDITQHITALQRLETEATTDALTGVLNRRRAQQLIEAEIPRLHSEGRAFSLLMIDVDHFKAVNDAYGHQAGDAVLQSLASTCLRSSRSVDIVGRFGGEEFIVGLPGASLADAARAAERIRISVSNEPIAVEGREIRVTVSIGVATSSAISPVSASELLRLADQRMYSAKKRGRNNVAVD